MAAKQETSPLTNTRMLIAGVACGLVGVILAWVTVNLRVEQAVGTLVEVAYMTRTVTPDDQLDVESDIDSVALPEKAYQRIPKLVLYQDARRLRGDSPVFTLERGMPLLASAFLPAEQGGPAVPEPPADQRLLQVRVEGTTPGQVLRVGAVVDLSARLPVGPDQYQNVTVLRAARIQTIQGTSRPNYEKLSRVTQVGVFVPQDMVNYVRDAEGYARGSFAISILGRNQVAASEVPDSTRRLLEQIRTEGW